MVFLYVMYRIDIDVERVIEESNEVFINPKSHHAHHPVIPH